MFFPVTMSAGTPPTTTSAPEAPQTLVVPAGATLIPARVVMPNGVVVEADGRVPEEVVSGFSWAVRNTNGTVSCVLCHHKGGNIIGRRNDLNKHKLNSGHKAYVAAVKRQLADNMTNDVASEEGVSLADTEARYFEEARGQIAAAFRCIPWDPFAWPEYSCDFLSRRAIVLSRLAGTSWSRNRRVRRLVSHVYRNDFVVCSVILCRVFLLERFRQKNNAVRRRSLRLAQRRDEALSAGGSGGNPLAVPTTGLATPGKCDSCSAVFM